MSPFFITISSFLVVTKFKLNVLKLKTINMKIISYLYIHPRTTENKTKKINSVNKNKQFCP